MPQRKSIIRHEVEDTFSDMNHTYIALTYSAVATQDIIPRWEKMVQFLALKGFKIKVSERRDPGQELYSQPCSII